MREAARRFFRESVQRLNRFASLPSLMEVPALTLLGLAWGLLVLQGLFPMPGDENTYFYAVREILRGSLPYRDFFFAHPPGHLLLPALFLKLGGFSIEHAKWVSPVLIASSAVLYWRVARASSGRAVGCVALGLYLFSFSTLSGASLFVGSESVLFWLSLGVWALTGRSPALAGGALGLALGSALYAAPLVFAVLIWAPGGGSISRLRLWFGFVGALAMTCLPFWVLAPTSFWEGVFLYHLRKPSQEALPVFFRALFEQTEFWFAAAVYPFWLFKSETSFRRERILEAGLLGALLLLIAVLWVRQPWDYYLYPAYGLLSWLLAVEGVAWFRHAFRMNGLRFILWLGMPFAALGVSKTFAHLLAYPDQFLPERQGMERTYVWQRTSSFPVLDELTRKLFWSERRRVGSTGLPWEYYLWRVNRRPEVFQAIGAKVTTQIAPDGRIFGPPSMAALIALFADRRLAGDEVDLNPGKSLAFGLPVDWTWQKALQDPRLRGVVTLDEPILSAGLPMTDDWADQARQRGFTRVSDWTDSQFLYGKPLKLTLWVRMSR